MLATLSGRRFSDPAWVYERKLDGQRCLAFCDRRQVKLLSRARHSLSGTYPEIVDAFVAQARTDCVVDGEVVAFEQGRTSFSRLQQRLGITDPERARVSPVAVTFYAFDLLYAWGYDVTGLALRDRKALLRRALRFAGPLRYTAHRNADGEAYLRQACAWGWEGLIAKQAGSIYVSRRSTAWLKLKCASGQEVVVGGFTDPAGSRVGLGALLVGYYDDGGRLVYAGKVGTGFSEAVLRQLRHRLDALEVRRSPFEPAPGAGGPAVAPATRGVHWVRPELVAEVGFTEWTGDGKLRHPRFVGLRDDKAPDAVRRERAVVASGRG